MGVKERLAELMEATGLTNQSELARRLDPPESPTWINNRLTGYSTIKADEVPRLANALGIDCSAFYVDSECPEHQEGTSPEVPLRWRRLERKYETEYVALTDEDRREVALEIQHLSGLLARSLEPPPNTRPA